MSDPPEDEDVGDIGEVFLAEDEEGLLGGEDAIEEQDAVDVLLSWKQTRQSISKEKLSRGLSSGGLKKLEARVKCFKCQKVGHFSRNCPLRKGKDGGKGDSSSSSTKVSFVCMVNESAADDGESQIDAVMRSWSERPRDSWTFDEKEVIRHHPKDFLFSPARTGCPIPLNELSMARMTVMKNSDGTTEEQFAPNWKNSLEAHRRTDKTWTGKTIFYRVQGHGDPEPEDLRQLSDEALFRLFDPEDVVYGSEYAYQVEGVDQEVEELQQDDQWEMVEGDEFPGAFKEPSSGEEDGESRPQESNCGLVHAAGYGTLDTGCGRGLVGENTLARHIERLEEHGHCYKELPEKMHTFRYDNGSADRTGRRVELPVFVAGRELRVRLHVVSGDVPLLISKGLLKSLGPMIDLNTNKLVMTKAGIAAPIHEMKDNSYQINLLDMEKGVGITSPEVDVMKVDAFHKASSQEEDEEEIGVHCVFKAKERKQVAENMSAVLAQNQCEAPTVMEFFSPGRFQELAGQCGMVGRGASDLSEGWDWRRKEDRTRAEQAITIADPDFSVFSPPCGPLSLMQNLTPEDRRSDPKGHQLEVKQAKDMIRWSLNQAELRIEHGRFFVFESSKTSGAWRTPEMQAFARKHSPFLIDVPACSVGLRDPQTGLLFGKSWRFMTNCQTVAAALGKLTCDKNHEHQVVEGTSAGMLPSIRTQVYPNRLIRIILGAMAQREAIACQCMAVSQATVQGDLKGEGRRRVERAINKLHVNLGHASRADMLRILRHHHAQESVLELVKSFECSVCQARVAPKVAKESAPPRDIAPLRYIGLDVKHLPSWKPHEKIKALNVVCRMSGLQQMYPFKEQEAAEVIGRLYRNWTRSYGRPRHVKFDASRCNLGQTFLDMLERDGTTPLDIPGEAHEQMGDVESQGWHFEETFRRVVDQMSPQDFCNGRNVWMSRSKQEMP